MQKDAAAHAKLKVIVTSQIDSTLLKVLYQIHRTNADAGKNSVRERWNRAAFFASKLRDGNEVMNTTADDPDSLPVQKQLETQHWLELIDAYAPNFSLQFVLC